MEQSSFEKIVYLVVGAVFFFGYYLLVKEVFKVNPFTGLPLIASIYFIIAIFTFARAGKIVSEKVNVVGISSKVLMPIAYVFGPILVFFNEINK